MKKIIKLFVKNQSSGFTVIELVVVMVILVIIATSSFVGFNQYNKTQKLNSEVENLKTNINEAKSSALTGFINKCDSVGLSLYGYRLLVVAATSYRLEEACINAGGTKTYNQLSNKMFTLQPGITFTSTGISVTFLAVTGSPEAAQTFTLTNGSSQQPVTVDSSGVIK